jgi:hypothetical protein
MAQRKASVKPEPDRRREKSSLTLWEQEYVETKPRFEPAPLPDTVPQDSVLRQDYSLEFLMNHPEIADEYVREVERHFGPLPKVHIQYNTQANAKKKTAQPRKATARRR